MTQFSEYHRYGENNPPLSPETPHAPDCTMPNTLSKAQHEITYLRARVAELKARLREMTRRRDAWKEKAEGYDEVRRALREKVGSPWPPNLSRILWAGIAADEKKRADDAEVENADLRALVADMRRTITEQSEQLGAAGGLGAELGRLREDKKRLMFALTPSGETKAAYIAKIQCDASEHTHPHHVPWTSTKRIMRMILDYAAVIDPRAIDSAEVVRREGENAAARQRQGSYMTEQEREIVETLGDIWNLFLKLPVEHPMGRVEFAKNLHALQNHVAARCVFRQLKAEQEQRA